MDNARGLEADEDENDDSLNEVVMAVDVRDRGTVGCAYYIAREEKLLLMEDVKLGGADIVEACMFSFRTVVQSP